jgi:hypothetical protein
VTPNQALQQTVGHESFLGLQAFRCYPRLPVDQAEQAAPARFDLIRRILKRVEESDG